MSGKITTRLGFTLAELLIALAILGVIATFIIPKILDSGSGSQHNAAAKEAASMISGALQNYKLAGNEVTASTSGGDFTPYMNYVGIQTTGGVDGNNSACTYFNNLCSVAGNVCLKLHNGALLRYDSTDSYASTSATAAIYFHFDPDGRTSGSSDLNGKGLYLYLYHNGRLRTKNTIEANTQSDNYTNNPVAGCDPPWFSWSN